jgi:hypothetical protein
MIRKSSVDAQINRASFLLPTIEAKYQNSLNKKTISDDLKLDIQTFCGHLRSALDYIAKDIVDTHCPNANPRNRLYFPITKDAQSFSSTMSRLYPDLDNNCNELYAILESVQPFKSNKNTWLSHFNKVNNENKHNDLVEQTRTETKRIDVQIQGGGRVKWNPANLKFGSGVFIGGVPVKPQTQMPVPSPIQKVTIETWFDFRFDGIDVSALALLRDSLNNIGEIASDAYKYI